MVNATETRSQIDPYWPIVELKPKQKKVHILGISRMPDPSKYYSKLSNQLEEYFHEFDRVLSIEFYFDYINSGSTKWLYFLMQHLEHLKKNGGLIEVIWNYDDDDESIELAGDVLKSQTSLPFHLVPIER